MSSIAIGQVELDVIQGVFSLLGILVTVSVPILLPRLFALLAAHKVVLDQQEQNLLADAIHAAAPRALSYAENKLETKIDPNSTIETKNAVLATAANYLIANKSETLTKLGITPATTSAAIKQILIAHMPAPTQT